MTIGRRKGFTLIELLVVIAIIGILAAMVFPVFARARESARKAVCIANVKNLALAFTMYLNDNDSKYFPWEHRLDVRTYFGFTLRPINGKDMSCMESCQGLKCKHATYYGNPYLRPAVILDEYVRSRSVWSCPSAKVIMGATVINGCVPDWFTWKKNMDASGGTGNQGTDADKFGTCYLQFPKGWGGTVTDSLLQWATANFYGANEGGAWGQGDPAKNVFVQTYGTGDEIFEENMERITADPTTFVTVADEGAIIDELSAEIVAYPEVCQLSCASSVGVDNGCDEGYGTDFSGDLLTDVSNRMQYSRHLGGSNLGFLDGHAAWMPSETILDKYFSGELTGVGWEMGPWSGCGAADGTFAETYPGVPTLR